MKKRLATIGLIVAGGTFSNGLMAADHIDAPGATAEPTAGPPPPSASRWILGTAAVVWALWLLGMVDGDRWALFGEAWFMSVTMAFGSFVAGATSEGGGAVVVGEGEAFFLMKGSDERQQGAGMFGPREGQSGGHRRASRSVSSWKKPSASMSPMKSALGARSVTPHQSATVMPMVSSDVVSISTLMWRPVKSSGLIR